MKCPKESLQNLSYFLEYKKNHVVSFFKVFVRIANESPFNESNEYYIILFIFGMIHHVIPK